MFKFKFHKSDDEDNDADNTCIKKWVEAKKINVESKICNYVSEYTPKIFKGSDFNIQYVSSIEIIDKLKNVEECSNSILRAEIDHSDLVTAEYEGGLKIWECTSDLINYLSKENIDFKNKKVLDLGCGAGLLGIYALLKESLVDFQDYNKEVIEYTTIPNVFLNKKDDIFKLCSFYSGDWNSFININSSKYDYILTAETIYNPDNYKKLCDVFDKLLEDNGVIYLAAKTYYFGVGGGTREFEKLLKCRGLHFTVIWNNVEGVQREILKIVKNK